MRNSLSPAWWGAPRMSVTLHGQCFSAGPLLRLLPLHITCHAIPAASAHRRSLIIYCRAASLRYTFLHQRFSQERNRLYCPLDVNALMGQKISHQWIVSFNHTILSQCSPERGVFARFITLEIAIFTQIPNSSGQERLQTKILAISQRRLQWNLFAGAWRFYVRIHHGVFRLDLSTFQVCTFQ